MRSPSLPATTRTTTVARNLLNMTFGNPVMSQDNRLLFLGFIFWLCSIFFLSSEKKQSIPISCCFSLWIWRLSLVSFDMNWALRIIHDLSSFTSLPMWLSDTFTMVLRTFGDTYRLFSWALVFWLQSLACVLHLAAAFGFPSAASSYFKVTCLFLTMLRF